MLFLLNTTCNLHGNKEDIQKCTHLVRELSLGLISNASQNLNFIKNNLSLYLQCLYLFRRNFYPEHDQPRHLCPACPMSNPV